MLAPTLTFQAGREGTQIEYILLEKLLPFDEYLFCFFFGRGGGFKFGRGAGAKDPP